MKILQIIPSISSLTGGPSKSVPALCKALARLGHSVELWATDYWAEANKGRERDARHPDGYNTIIYPHKNTIFAPGMPSSKQLVNTLEDKCSQFDLVHVHGLWNPVATFSMRLLRRKGRSYCLSPRGVLDPVVFARNRWKKIPWMWLWDRDNVEGASLLHWTSAAEYEKAGRSGWRFSKSVIVPNVIDLEEWTGLPAPVTLEQSFPQIEKKDVVLFAGRINWVKNIDLLIRALCIVRQKRPSAVLVCAGPDNDDYQPELVRLAESLGLRDAVLFTGMLNADALKAAFARAQVFALVSKKENFGMAAAEALASGLPVVLSEGVDLGREWPAYAFVARVKEDPADIASGILKMFNRVSQVGTPDPEARALAMEQWGLSSTEKLVDAYKEVLDI